MHTHYPKSKANISIKSIDKYSAFIRELKLDLTYAFPKKKETNSKTIAQIELICIAIRIYI